MKKNKIKLIIFLLIIIGIILYLIINKISFEKTNNSTISDYTPEQEISDEEFNETTLTLYFPNKENGEIETEGKSINSNQLLKNPYLIIIQKLLEGPSSEKLSKFFPDNTQILNASIEKNCVLLNFSEQLLNFENNDQKLQIINCILNSLTQLNEVTSIKFLINGEKNDIFNEEFSTL